MTMGASNGYCRPVQPTDGRMSSWTAHTNRGVPSVEPGTDYYCPRGTPVRAAASGRVVDVGDSIQPATGRFVTIDLDDGRRVRYLHLERRHVNVGDRVQWGQRIADSGATGYGETDWSWNVAETGGSHVHMTLWAQQRYTFGRYATIDPELYMAQAAGNHSIELSEEDDMPIMVKANTNIYLLDTGFIKLFNKTLEVAEAKADGIRQIDLTGTTAQQNAAFARRLDRYGIPRDVVAHAKGWVLNPQTGKHEENGMWSWDRAKYAQK